MTLAQWLDEATSAFPVAVQTRLAQEYRAHFEDHLDAGGVNDPVVVFGDPGKAKRAWGRVYLGRKEYLVFQSYGFPAGIYMWMTLTMPSRLASPVNSVVEGLVLMTVITLWWLTRQMPAVRRAILRLAGGLILGGLIQVAYLFWPQHPDAIFRTTAGIEVLVGLVMLWVFPLLDARARRTLALEGAVAR
ncbi:hypothetical protein [Deinococcus sp. UYEF24]